jgi:hypothetical protein
MYFFSDGQVSRANYFLDTDAQLHSIINSGLCNENKNNGPVTESNSANKSTLPALHRTPANEQLVIYPSPAYTNIVVEFNSAQKGISEISVFNQSGILVLKQKIAAEKGANRRVLDVSRLLNGTYLVQLQQGESRSTTKILVQH